MPVTISPPKFFSVEEANARVPLVNSILRDVTELSHELKGLHERLILSQTDGSSDPAVDAEVASLSAELDRKRLQMEALEKELAQIGAVLKDDFMGLVDFPAMFDGREVCLCYKYGEPEIAYWHDVDAGYGGRRRISPTHRVRGSR
jgi:hypothetical protein